MRQADPGFDMSPKGRALFADAVEREKELIRRRGFLEFEDNGRMIRIPVPVMPTVMCAAFECPSVVVGKAVYCFAHAQRRAEEERGR